MFDVVTGLLCIFLSSGKWTICKHYEKYDVSVEIQKCKPNGNSHNEFAYRFSKRIHHISWYVSTDYVNIKYPDIISSHVSHNVLTQRFTRTFLQEKLFVSQDVSLDL